MESIGRCLTGSPSDRPKAIEWAGTLKKFAEKSKGLLEHCIHQHLHFKDMDCATCLREQTIDHAKTAAASRSAIPPSLPKNTSHTSIQSGSTNTSFPGNISNQSPGNTPLSRPSWIQPKSLAQQTQSQATAPSGVAQTASQSSVQQSLTSPSSFKFVEFVWAILKKFLPTIAILAAALLATPVGWGLLGISLVAGYFIGIKFWITSLALVFLFYKLAEDEFADEWARVLVSLAAGVLFTGLIFAGISIYGYFHPGNETANIEGTKNVKAVESLQAIADIPAPISPQKQDTKQEPPQNTEPHSVTWSDTWPKTAPVAQETPAVQESTNRSNSDRNPVAGLTVGQVNENSSGTRGWLGVDAQPLTSELASSMNLGSSQRGVIINNVVKGGPADIAGMVAGDLLVSVDNKAVDTEDAIRNVLSNIAPGRVVPIKIIRDGREMYLLLTIAQRP